MTISFPRPGQQPIRRLMLLAGFAAACSTNAVGAAGPAVSVVPATDRPTAVASTPAPTVPPSPTAPPATTYTADDAAIAQLVRAGADEAVPRLRGLNDADPSKLQALFVPLGNWITAQVKAVEAYTPSSCTADAVGLFLDGMDQYDDIRKDFTAWRDWGAHGHAFAPAAPREAADTLEDAIVELSAHCTE